MICLNSVIEFTIRASTIFLHVGASSPVVRSCEVVRITGVGRVDVLEVLHVAAPNAALVCRDAADIIRVLLNEIGVEVAKRAAHLIGVFLIHAKDDRLREAIGLLQEV